MNWGILQGLGQGLQQVGSSLMEQDADKRRAELADKLADARIKRTVADRRLENVGGKYVWREVNAYGEPIREVEASPEEVKKIQNEAKLSDISVRKGSADAAVAEVTAADAPASIERKIAEHQSSLASAEESRRASKDASARGWKGLELEGQRNTISEKGLAAKLSGKSGDGKPTELSTVARQLRKDYDKMVTSLMEDITVNLTESEAQELARNSAAAAVREGKDFGDVYRRALMNFADQRKAGRK